MWTIDFDTIGIQAVGCHQVEALKIRQGFTRRHLYINGTDIL
jgi:hypothetical protein